ncbi:MbtH family protein [Rhodococcus sp. ABRD24]|uniref:MbtH family protein n=1 Tax=Rhodococcus sp. ABRD24 TaxID=2507582 RepID=UPI0024181B48|nr:MbtH family protein [Rhodococcus sp. ABRD24]
MTNPFDDSDASFMVLVNEENQHSLWPARVDVPAGWSIAHNEDTRRACIDYIDANWTDLRPGSLLAAEEHDSTVG